MIYCCEEHVEVGLDVIVDEYETAPVLTKFSDEKRLLITCGYCEKSAVYIVANE
ncbi:hypothetical protein PB1_07482 [Bacillus methanolicus PB1]|uniref:CxxH/CxxC protein n=1 Tax=Bacillus methanolicus PB1 TaxID=997296 RepID=I3E113_BACMT|nr:CxxH/CxxC protein [Bacillus methanolicus]EIJ80184.1 hypothetical protein PB1_07482 [Bacillus methanolicus PB1]